MSNGMEPEVKKYLMKVLNSLSIGILWLMLNATFGIYYGFALIEGKIHLANILFYTVFIISLGCLIWYYYRVWKK